MPAKVVIIAALEREVRVLVRGSEWRRSNAIAVPYGVFESDSAVVVCAGIGAEPARRAAQAALEGFRPPALVSAGLAGALTGEYRVGDVICPATILDAQGAAISATIEIAACNRRGVLVSSPVVAGRANKRSLAERYGADIVDMEAAAVAQVAAQHEVPFVAIKAVSDELDFPMPDTTAFVDAQGRFLTGRFLLHTCVRPATWSVVSKLASNSAKASRELCRVLRTWFATNQAGLLLRSETKREQLQP
ncbi:MAG: phosphorylase [Terriglobales bacterium]